MVLQLKVMTTEQFWALLPTLDPDKQYELIEGDLVEMAASKKINSFLAMRLGKKVSIFVDDNDLGYVFGADGGYNISPINAYIPDVSFISKKRSPEFPTGNDLMPDVTIEVISDSETSRSINRKSENYLRAGTLQVWNVYPDDKIIEVWRMLEDDKMSVQVFTVEMTLTAEDVLPGFKLVLAELFPKENL
jgi:Uma2 family endonuclease